MEAEQLGLFERAYKHLNSPKSAPVPTYIWLLLGVALISVAIADTTGYPEKYVAPITIFLIEGIYELTRTRGRSWKKLAIITAACVGLFLVFAKMS